MLNSAGRVVGGPGEKPVECSANTFVISALVRGGRVTDAWSTGKMVHDMRFLLGMDLGGTTPRIARTEACLCSAAHALAAVRALENLAGVEIPPAARLVRNLSQATVTVGDHLAHFYHFHLSDWLNLGRALRADSAGAARIEALRIKAALRDGHQPDRDDPHDIAQARERLAGLARGKAAGFFGVDRADHPAYAGGDEIHLLGYAHLDSATLAGERLRQAMKALGCAGADHPAFQPGGLARTASGAGGGSPDLSPDARRRCRALLEQCARFVNQIFLDDALSVFRAYSGLAGAGTSDALLCWDEYPGLDGAFLMPGGLARLAPEPSCAKASPERIVEHAQPGWTPADAEHYRLRFGTGGEQYVWTGEGFEWFATPRHQDLACEVGPMARIVHGHLIGAPEIRNAVIRALDAVNMPLAAMDSIQGRMLARALEAAVLMPACLGWLDDLDRVLADPDAALFAPWAMPDSGQGTGLAEIARGALVHRIRVEHGRITGHDYLVPSLWNFSARTADGVRGPLERALLGTPVAHMDHPLEILRAVHAFDPCNACAVRIENADTGLVRTISAK